MQLLKRLLVAIDFGPTTDETVTQAVSLAKAFGSKLSLLTVLPTISANPLLGEIVRDKATERMRALADRIVAEGVASVDALLEEGMAPEQIVRHAVDLDANVIILGSSSQPGGESRRVGHTAERVIRSTDKPVWLVKPGGRAAFRRILCPVDSSESARRALNNAIYLARTFDADLIVVTVVAPLGGLLSWLIPISQEAQDEYIQEQQARHDKFIEEFTSRGVRLTRLVRQGDPPDEILAVCREVTPDLLIMGSVGWNQQTTLTLGSVAEQLLELQPCSIVLIRAEPIIRPHLDTEPIAIEDRCRLGYELLEEGFLDEASRQFKRCLQAWPLYPDAWDGLAAVCEQLGWTEEAEQHRQQAQQVTRTLAEERIQADIRVRHPLWRRQYRQTT